MQISASWPRSPWDSSQEPPPGSFNPWFPVDFLLSQVVETTVGCFSSMVSIMVSLKPNDCWWVSAKTQEKILWNYAIYEVLKMPRMAIFLRLPRRPWQQGITCPCLCLCFLGAGLQRMVCFHIIFNRIANHGTHGRQKNRLGLSIGHKLSYYQGYYWIPCYTHTHIYIYIGYK